MRDDEDEGDVKEEEAAEMGAGESGVSLFLYPYFLVVHLVKSKWENKFRSMMKAMNQRPDGCTGGNDEQRATIYNLQKRSDGRTHTAQRLRYSRLQIDGQRVLPAVTTLSWTHP